MSDYMLIGFLVFLGIISVIDIWTFNKKDIGIPSIITTTFLFIAFIYNPSPQIAILAGIIGLALNEINLWKGLADIKVFIATSLYFTNLLMPTILCVITVLLSFALSFVLEKLLKQNYKLNIPFIPIIMIAFILSLILF